MLCAKSSPIHYAAHAVKNYINAFETFCNPFFWTDFELQSPVNDVFQHWKKIPSKTRKKNVNELHFFRDMQTFH